MNGHNNVNNQTRLPRLDCPEGQNRQKKQPEALELIRGDSEDENKTKDNRINSRRLRTFAKGWIALEKD